MRKLVVSVIAASTVILASTGASLADPNLPNVGAHRHFIETPTGLVEVGPRLCDNPSLQQAFNQFHFNVHHSHIRIGGTDVYIPSLGPQEGAPGLHNGRGADLAIGRC
jgi:hypothetical protein